MQTGEGYGGVICTGGFNGLGHVLSGEGFDTLAARMRPARNLVGMPMISTQADRR